LTYGIRRKECIYLGAGVGIGKTDWALQLQEHLINFHGLTPGLIMLEQPVGRTLKTLAGKFAGIPFHKPDATFTQDELIAGIDRLRDKVYLFNHYGVKDWESVKRAIRTMVVYYGIKDIFIDPITALVSHLSSGEANDEVNKIAGELASMVHELDFTAYGFSHLNKPVNGPPHERGGTVHEGQFTGSRGLMRYGNYLYGLERNKDPEITEAERNVSKFVLLKDREFGNSGSFYIKYNKETSTYLE
jgi:twinkle protein